MLRYSGYAYYRVSDRLLEQHCPGRAVYDRALRRIDKTISYEVEVCSRAIIGL